MVQQKPSKTAFQIAAASVFAALVFVATYLFSINIPATTGYFNFGETIIYVVALLFGPLSGALSGGIGAATSDIMLGYSQFAPGTLTIKLIEGTIVGFLYRKLQTLIPNRSISAAIAITIGGLEMVAGYFIYEQLVLGYPLTVALVELPFNLVQMAVGLIIAIPIMHAVLRVFPQLKSWIPS
jgi:uncharacterized membrane protein